MENFYKENTNKSILFPKSNASPCKKIFQTISYSNFEEIKNL